MMPAGPGMTEGTQGIYIAWDIFEEFATKGSLHLKEMVVYALNKLLPEKTLKTNLPAQGLVTLQEQTASQRLVNHLLYVVPVKRGENVEIVEDIGRCPLYRAETGMSSDGRYRILRILKICLNPGHRSLYRLYWLIEYQTGKESYGRESSDSDRGRRQGNCQSNRHLFEE
jgi:hypothetical protein